MATRRVRRLTRGASDQHQLTLGERVDDALGQQRGHLVHQEGSREVEALPVVAAERAEGGLVDRLDPFGGDLHAERLSERDHRPQHRRRVFRASGGIDVGAVDLEHLDRKLTQVAQRGIAGPEVVDRDLHTDRR
jgi:hypothetical protein